MDILSYIIVPIIIALLGLTYSLLSNYIDRPLLFFKFDSEQNLVIFNAGKRTAFNVRISEDFISDTEGFKPKNINILPNSETEVMDSTNGEPITVEGSIEEYEKYDKRNLKYDDEGLVCLNKFFSFLWQKIKYICIFIFNNIKAKKILRKNLKDLNKKKLEYLRIGMYHSTKSKYMLVSFYKKYWFIDNEIYFETKIHGSRAADYLDELYSSTGIKGSRFVDRIELLRKENILSYKKIVLNKIVAKIKNFYKSPSDEIFQNQKITCI